MAGMMLFKLKLIFINRNCCLLELSVSLFERIRIHKPHDTLSKCKGINELIFRHKNYEKCLQKLKIF